MGWNEKTRTQKTVNIFKIILYELKMGLNHLKWALTSSNFNKIFTSDAYHCKAWYIYDFSSGVINVKIKEKKKRFL